MTDEGGVAAITQAHVRAAEADRSAQTREATARETRDVFVFRVEDTWLALDARVVESVLEDQGCTPVPGAPPHVLGVIVHGERVLALFDVATFCGVAPRADSYNGFPRTFIVHAGGFTVGIRADLAAGVVDVAAPDIVAVAALQGERLVPYLLGEVKTPWGLAGLLDTARILEDACVRE